MGKLYKVDHEYSLPAEKVIQRARSRVGKVNYNLIENNCEHFATWCKTGKGFSSQVYSFSKGVVTKSAGIAGGALKAGGGALKAGGGALLSRTATAFTVCESAYGITKAIVDRDPDKLKKEGLKVYGLATGSMIGSLICPGIGTTIGATVGHLVGHMSDRWI